MKKAAFIAVLLITALSTATFAQNEKKQGSRKTAEERTEMMTRKLTQELTLTSDQQGQVRALLLDREKQRDAGTLDRNDRTKTDADINALLTKDQQEKWAKMKEEARAKHKAQKGQPKKDGTEKPKAPSEDLE